ncbi:60S ribosomal protein L7a [Intoshia linei]|uniref:60S ribosomal protein L7a n=1 Tax=Intoshia linei TaxID=1819745 RepID=A0A177ARZ6_9BILA|nr:60S ribosomal protein L7a [Intoshia linei]
MVKVGRNKIVASNPIDKAKAAPRKKTNPLFKSHKRDYRIGRAIQFKRNLRRFVKWPKYIKMQRQKQILFKRLKVPPPIHQFSQTLDKQTFDNLWTLMNKYKPETKEERKNRLKIVSEKRAAGVVSAKPQNRKKCIVFGVNEIVTLIEKKKAKLVVISFDVDPIELVVYLPCLCRRMGVPYCIVKGKARLGKVVDMKNCAVVAFDKVLPEDQNTFSKLCEAINNNFSDRFNHIRKTWGIPELGSKSIDKIEKLERIKLREAKALIK